MLTWIRKIMRHLKILPVSGERKRRKVYIIAGEPSGDAIGAKVLMALRAFDVEISGVGGPKMQKEGLVSLFDIGEISIGGVVELIPHVLKIKKLIRRTTHDIISNCPDVILTIDSPGFCFRVVKLIRKLSPGIGMVHLVAPSVWAWRSGRAKKIAKLYDVLLTLFDFEPQYFLKHGLHTKCVGHPMIEEFHEDVNKSKDDLLLLMPGSRIQEIKKMLPVFLEFCDKYQATRYVIPTLPHLVPLIQEYLGARTWIEVIFDEREKNSLYRRAKLAIAASGTATIQLTLAGCPMIVCYKMNNITYKMIKRIIKTKYISLVNIISNRRVVPELIQRECRADKILQVASDMDTNEQIRELCLVRNGICNLAHTPSEKIAEIIVNVKMHPTKS
ncbi:MAG: lipid-A-disaccharide synthase [Holosporales bacterium]|jgi:lipid-A-disaccharide synthase|nr:lipid-A-disaccharide synthase [Holosporales bacterium]